MIALNRTYLTGNEKKYIEQVLENQTSGNGAFTKKCHQFFLARYGFKKVLLTSSCTDALEMSALLLDIKAGDEVIMPSFTFVSTANAFILRGARVVFADSMAGNPNIDPASVERLITSRTKAIVVVHYAGVAVDMDSIMELARRHNLFVVEDAAQAIDGYYKNRPLGGIGHLGCFSFHDTKNIVSGEGGLLVVNDDRFIERAEIVWEKGTNRSAFIRGEVDKYGWVDVGSSFLPSELTAAFLYAQLENMDAIQGKRMEVWSRYQEKISTLASSGRIIVPCIPDYARHNAHIYYIVCDTPAHRDLLIEEMKRAGVQAFFHYPALHLSKYYLETGEDRKLLPNAERFSSQLLRLPLYVSLKREEQDYVIEQLESILNKF